MIGQERAIGIARQRAAEKGWAFAEPLQVTVRKGWLGGERYEIETNAGMRGTKARFVVDAGSGKILSEGYLSR